MKAVIFADHSIVSMCYSQALRHTPGVTVGGFFEIHKPVSNKLVEQNPDVVIVDDTQENRERVDERLREIKAALPRAKIILVTMYTSDPDRVDGALKAGASALLSKEIHPVTMGALAREIYREAVVTRPFVVAQPPAAPADCPLTDRELEILKLLAQGYTNGRIARELWVTEQTVKFHLSNTYRKLGVGNRTEAARYAHSSNLFNFNVGEEAQVILLHRDSAGDGTDLAEQATAG